MPELSKSTVYFDGLCRRCQAEIGYYRRQDEAGVPFISRRFGRVLHLKPIAEGARRG